MEISPAKRVGRIIELLRSESGKTQVEVAKEAHCSPSLVSHLENGSKGAHVNTVTSIGGAIGYKEIVTELWGVVGPPGTAATGGLPGGGWGGGVNVTGRTQKGIHRVGQTQA